MESGDKHQLIVLGKTKLGESDLIIKGMIEDGSRLELIAKGARKPQNANSSKLELFNEVRILLGRTKGLPIAKEVKLLHSARELHFDPMRNAAASTVASFASRIVQPELPLRSIYPMTLAAFERLGACEERQALPLVSAYLLKASTISGFMPYFLECAACGSPLFATSAIEGFDMADGGALCHECLISPRSTSLSLDEAKLLQFLLSSKFDDIVAFDFDPFMARKLFERSMLWAETQFSFKSKPAALLLSFGNLD